MPKKSKLQKSGHKKQPTSGPSEDRDQNKPSAVSRSVQVESEKDSQDSEQHVPQLISPKDIASLYRSDKKRVNADMSKIERRDPNRTKKIIAWIVVGALLLLGVSIAGFYFFVDQQSRFSKEDVVIDVQIPTPISAGEEFSMVVSVSNNSDVDLRNVELTLRYPSGFTAAKAVPIASNAAQNAWELDEIKKGKSTSVTITGQVVGAIGTSKDFSTLLSYVPSNFNSEFQNTDEFDLTISSSILDLDVDIPVKVVSGREANYSVIITNNAEEVIEQIVFAMDLPGDFTVNTFDPEPFDADDYEWEIASMEGGESLEISFSGTMEGDEGTMREISSEVGYRDSGGTYYMQAEETSIISIINPQLILDLSINGSNEDSIASFGETLQYVLEFRNESQSTIRDMSIFVEIDSEVINWDSIKFVDDGEVSGSRIKWSFDAEPTLKVITPGSVGTIEFSVDVKDNILATEDDDKNHTIISSAQALSSDVADLEDGSLEIESNKVKVKINSRLDLRAEGRYYNDEYITVGDGPLPPAVNGTTTYQIFWYLQNNTNEVSNVTAVAEVPVGATWTGDASVSAGTISYDSESREVTWSINKIPPHVGQLIPELSAQFGISVTPTATDVGDVLDLLGVSTATADDTFTQIEVSDEEIAITTTLESDPLASGKDEVVSKSTTNTNSNTNSATNSNTNTADSD